MKTIFITIFEGVEAKNIVRTSVITEILKDVDTRVVIFVKNSARVKHYERDFPKDRVFFEVINLPQAQGVDRFLQRIKFLLLRTESTIIWRKLNSAKTGKRISYHVGNIANLLLGNRGFLIKVLRFVDYHFVRTNYFEEYIDRYKPESVVLPNLFDEPEIYLLREARRKGITTIGVINSWDRVTSRSVIRQVPDYFIVFSELIKEDLVRFDRVRLDSVFVGGVPHYDVYAQAPFKDRESFFRGVGMDLKKPFIVYCPFGLLYDSDDWKMIKYLCDLNDKNAFGKRVSILVRCPPNDEVDRSKFESRPDLYYEFPGTRFEKNIGRKTTDWDMTALEMEHLADELYYMSLIVGYASSISIDAVFSGRPAINIDFDLDKKPELLSLRHHYGKRHYQQAIVTGGLRMVRNTEELTEWIRKYLADQSIDTEARKILTLEQCTFIDGKSGERIGRHIVKLTKS